MKNILLLRNRQFLDEVLSGQPLLVFDFDGTLAPIVDNYHKVKLRRSTQKRLIALASYFRIAVISGRSFEDLKRHLAGTPVNVMVGNHGVDWGDQDSKLNALKNRVQDWNLKIRKPLSQLLGVEIENKGLSLSVHYRNAKNKSEAHKLIKAVISTLKGLRVVGGKSVYNLVPKAGADKGVALKAVMKKFNSRSAIYIGDDITDEDAFRVCDRPSRIGVRVGRNQRSAAKFYIEGQAQMDTLLDYCLESADKRIL